MKYFYPTLLSLGLILILVFFAVELRAQVSNIQSITHPSSTSGMYQPESKAKLQKSPGTFQGTFQGSVPPVCVDSGIQGRRCGITAVTFCKLNPDAQNCQMINKEQKLVK